MVRGAWRTCTLLPVFCPPAFARSLPQGVSAHRSISQRAKLKMPGFETFSLTVMLWIAAAVLLAGFIQGALGFGFPLIATPMVAAAADMRTAVITVLIPTLATTIVTLFSCGPLGPV